LDLLKDLNKTGDINLGLSDPPTMQKLKASVEDTKMTLQLETHKPFISVSEEVLKNVGIMTSHLEGYEDECHEIQVNHKKDAQVLYSKFEHFCDTIMTLNQ
jgi:hypothetical protein